MKVKILSGSWPSSLENEVNRWLDGEGRRNEIIDIKYVVGDDKVSSMYRFSAMIIYK